MPDPIVELTHAVTIDASPEQVWPWLVQLGHGRAGFYSDSRFWDRCVDWYYRVLSRERTGKPEVGYHIEAADRIVSAWQNPRVGDIVADGPPGTATATRLLLTARSAAGGGVRAAAWMVIGARNDLLSTSVGPWPTSGAQRRSRRD